MAGEFSWVTVITGLASGYIASVLNQDRARWYETRNLANSLSAEIGNLNIRVRDLNLYINDFYKKRAHPSDKNLIEREKIEIPLIHCFNLNDMAVYNGNTSKIGLLKTTDAQTIVFFYILIRSISAQIEHLNKLSKGEYVINNTNIGDYDIQNVADTLAEECRYANETGKKLLRSIQLYHHNLTKYVILALLIKLNNIYIKLINFMKKVRENS